VPAKRVSSLRRRAAGIGEDAKKQAQILAERAIGPATAMSGADKSPAAAGCGRAKE